MSHLSSRLYLIIKLECIILVVPQRIRLGRERSHTSTGTFPHLGLSTSHQCSTKPCKVKRMDVISKINLKWVKDKNKPLLYACDNLELMVLQFFFCYYAVLEVFFFIYDCMISPYNSIWPSYSNYPSYCLACFKGFALYFISTNSYLLL